MTLFEGVLTEVTDAKGMEGHSAASTVTSRRTWVCSSARDGCREGSMRRTRALAVLNTLFALGVGSLSITPAGASQSESRRTLVEGG